MKAALLCLLLASGVQAQGVYKCSVDGKTAYQSTPCAGGKTVDIPAGPTADQVEQAKARLEADKSKVAGIEAAQEAQAQRQRDQAGRAPQRGAKVDCARLSEERARAFGQRNAAVRGSRQDNMDRSDQVQASHSRIQQAEAAMARAGCPLQ